MERLIVVARVLEAQMASSTRKFETKARILGMRLALQGCCRPLLLQIKVFRTTFMSDTEKSIEKENKKRLTVVAHVIEANLASITGKL